MTLLDTVLEWVSTAILTVLFAWMAVFLLSVTSAFAHSDMKVVRTAHLAEGGEGAGEGEGEEEGDGERQPKGLAGEVGDGAGEEEGTGSRPSGKGTPAGAASGDAVASTRAGNGEEREGEEEEEEEEWEGLETSELEERFNAAALLVVAMVTPPQGSAGQQAPSLGEGMQLLLYSLYKQATEGPCTSKQPAFFNLKARAKWDAWKQLGGMPAEEAMEKYVELVASVAPGFGAGSSQEEAGMSDAGAGSSGAGRSVSTFQDAEGEGAEDAGEQSSLVKCAASGDPESLVLLLAKLPPEAVNEQDEEGRTALHWAVDRGHVNSTRVLLQKGAAVDVQDSEGQTALHYAALCEHQEVAELLLEQGASRGIRDGDGKTPADLFPTSWR